MITKSTLNANQKRQLVSSVEPYLRAGLSIRKACLQSGVSRATLYRILDEDEELRDQIDRARDYLSVVMMGITSKQLHDIAKKQSAGAKLEWQDLQFLQWFATNSRACKDEFGRQSRERPSIDPQHEIQKLVKLIDSFASEATTNC